MACVLPFVALLASFALLNRGYYEVLGTESGYERQREIWGGNPAEVFSHWLDLVVMSGNAVLLAWLLVVEAHLRKRWSLHPWLMTLKRGSVGFGWGLSSLTAIVMDVNKGEGTVVFVLPILFVPLLGATYYLLRQLVRLVDWRPIPVAVMAVLFASGHLLAQVFYEPSETGALNNGIFPLWIVSVVLALGWAGVRGLVTGRFQRWFRSASQALRKPYLVLPILVLSMLIIIPVFWRAWSYHQPREELATQWLGELETRLTHAFVAELKRDHDASQQAEHDRIPLSDAARALLDDPRVKDGNQLRIFVPLQDSDFLYIWANDRFDYCDIRRLRRDGAEQMDQRFIDALLEGDGFHQTGLWSALWSRHLAGRVFKDEHGQMKAFGVITSRP
jgi:hypothetical protein